MKKKEWFDEWFDTKYYHILYKHRDFKEAETFITNLTRDLGMSSGNSVLDMACGKGRHSIFLNKQGFDVVGADLSSESIKAAKSFENDQLKFSVHDMREVFVEDQFDYVFNLFTSFGYFEQSEENYAAIKSMSLALKKNGFFVLDYLNPTVVINNLVPKEKKTIDGIEFHITREVKDNWIVKNISLEDNDKQFSFQERVRIISIEDFEEYFRKSGLSLERTYGNYQLESFDSLSSDRMIFIAKKHK